MDSNIMENGQGSRYSVAEEQSRHQVRLPKKLVVCCDGTWMDSDNGWKKGKMGRPGKPANPSNVTRIARAIKAQDDAKHPQIVYYQAGVGTGLGLYDQILGGGTGMGLSENIREAYAFLCSNYSPEDILSKPDSIFLVGFSRGAFTARSLGGFIAAVGILTKKAMPYFYECFQDWENAGTDGYEPQFFQAYANDTGETDILENLPRLKPAASPEENHIDTYMRAYLKHLLSLGLTQEVQIKCIGVWDTVGALGIPINPLFQRVLGAPAFVKEYRWFDTRVCDKMENAFQALALDEHRFPFSPAVWELDDGGKTNLKQVWFAGAHSNIGGSYIDYGQANLTLAWMMDHLAGHSRPPAKDFDPLDWLKFDDEFIDDCFKHNHRYYAAGESAYSGWAMGRVYDSNTFPMALTGALTRTPGRYPKTDYVTGSYSKTQMLKNTHEYIHSSVRARIDLAGNQVEPETWLQAAIHWLYCRLTFQKLLKPYHPQRKGALLSASGGPLEGWKLVDGHNSHVEPNYDIDMSPDGVKQIHWEYAGKGKVSTSVMKEDIFAEKGYEQRLLEHDKPIAEQVLYSNNKWHWFKKPERRNLPAKTF